MMNDSRLLKTNCKNFEESGDECNQAPLLTYYFCRAAPTETLFHLKSHANVIYVPKSTTSTAHPPPRIFACEDCTATPVRRWREMWAGGWLQAVCIRKKSYSLLWWTNCLHRSTRNHRVLPYQNSVIFGPIPLLPSCPTSQPSTFT